MMQRMKQWMVWLRRMPHSRGFGIQSPNDYAFVRYVVNEHWPYYAYDELDDLAHNGIERKLGRFYFRMANWLQPSVMLRDRYEAWWQAGCRKTRITDMPSEARNARGSFTLARIDIDDDATPLLACANSESVLIVEDIWREPQRWNALTRDERTAVCFDLYYCGVVFFDKKRHKRTYCINF